ncbi:MAG: hypothetical protein OSB26_02130 [Woeseiaceae bacterium]|nr:hypothetical protein [Woeseiaceae bacterium]
MDTPDTLLYVAGAAFLLGWLVGKIGANLGGRFQARKRDPRDVRIRNLDAELRIAQADSEKAKTDILEEQDRVARQDTVITEQLKLLTDLRRDLKESVMKTRELREELSNRAVERVISEVKLREVETELSVAHASTDLIATGVLDYSMTPDAEDEVDSAGRMKTAI